ncbi:MAG: tRNA-guanine transglycosylase [Parcubacteria group bacterium Athens0714_16]|nr:MAG: tRNA-guanine transglycosylase [Parcubacteria group bacterium Athens0714_16]
MFRIEKRISARGGSASGGKEYLGRVGEIKTSHGIIKTPAFSVVGTKATVKALTPEQVKDLGAEVVLANTYHLYLEPGDKIVKSAGGLGKFMNWDGPTITDSGGFQVFSLGSGFDSDVSKINNQTNDVDELAKKIYKNEEFLQKGSIKIKEEGVEFKSHIDGSPHFFTPEKSIEIQHNIGADIIFAFDECTSPNNSEKYLEEAMNRTHRWADRCLIHHKKLNFDLRKSASDPRPSAIYGIVQGGNNEKLRKESAKTIGAMDFNGFGIGGSFEKNDIDKSLVWINSILPEEKSRHLLGIGEPIDLFIGVENGIDTFDCVAPTRIARNGTMYTTSGKINILNAKYKNDFSKLDENCDCYTCSSRHGGASYTKAYLSHLFRSKEMLGATLASIHNLYFIVNLVKKMRQSILDDTFFEFKRDFLGKYLKGEKY